jgi:hypothetical protein
MKRTPKAMHANQTNQKWLHPQQSKNDPPSFSSPCFAKETGEIIFFSPWLLENGPVFLEVVCRQKTTSKIGKKHQEKKIPNLVVKASNKLC